MADTADVRCDSFNVLIFNVIKEIRSRKHRADYDTIYENISKNSAANINKEFIIERVDDLLKVGKLINKVTAKGLNSFFCDEVRTNVSEQEDSSESSETEKCIEPTERLAENNLEREINSAMRFENYADYLKGLADLKGYFSSQLSSLCTVQYNSVRMFVQ